MNDTTLSVQEQLHTVKHAIAETEPRAKAEMAYVRANPGSPMPQNWVGESARLAELKAKEQDLELQIAGQRLSDAISKLAVINAEIDRLQIARTEADRVCRQRAEHEAVIKFVNATKICMRMHWGYSWQIFREWYISGRGLRNGAPDCATFFLRDDQAAAAGVQFDLGAERAAVQLWLQAKDASDRAMMAWNQVCERKRALLREIPELASAA